MVIQTVKKEYRVLGYLKEERQQDIYLCEDGEDRSQCLVIRLKRPETVAAAVEFLYGQSVHGAFADFKDCFVSEEALWSVFSYHEGQPFTEWLAKGHPGMEERCEVVKGILERILLQDMPCYFAARCLELPNIYVNQGLQVSFQYGLAGVEISRSYTMQEVQQRLGEVARAVFQEELKKEVIQPIKGLLEDLGQLRYGDCLELYRAFLGARDQVLALPTQELEVPATWVFRVWGRVRKWFQLLKRALAIAALLAGALYLLWTIDDASQPAAPAHVVDQIGTVKLEGGEER